MSKGADIRTDLGGNSLQIARNSSPGIGMPLTPRRWCCRCEVEKPMKGGKVRGGMFTCAGCLPVRRE